MDVLKKSIEELAVTFSTRMDEFQKEVKSSSPATSPTSNFHAQFQTFRAFVMTALENLQLQLQLLSRQQDDMEARSRRKMLLLHGVPEARDENPVQHISKLLSEKLCLPDISVSSVSQCHRMGRFNSGDKPRALLVKFHNQDLRNKAWFAKTKLKGSGVTLSEFLTRGRHEAFAAARKRFGVSRSWTRDGSVVVLGADGKRRRVVSVAEVNAIPDSACITPGPSVAASDTRNVNTKPRKPAIPMKK